MKRPHLVVSAVNLVEGGTLTVLRACLDAARRSLADRWDITAIVHRAELVGVPGIRYIERPEIKPSWLARIRFEYLECQRLSRELQADFWLSMHDMTPRVTSPRQAVYCHNAMCFYRLRWREALLDPKMLAFSLLYGHVYGFNIRANRAVIVQQDWIRAAFRRRYGCRNVIVAHPVHDAAAPPSIKRCGTRFFYPSLPRVFKNFEILLEAWRLLCSDDGWRGELVVTVDGSENPYARRLVERFGGLRGVRFAGRMSASAVQDAYAEADCLVFPSRLETWGLPLTEARQHGLAIIAADLPYAHEAIGSYGAVSFFPPDDAMALATQMARFTQGTLDLQSVRAQPIAVPYAADWSALFGLLMADGPIEPARRSDALAAGAGESP